MQKYGIQTYFKSSRTLKVILATPKDKDMIKQKTIVISWHRFSRLDCDEEYIGESARTFCERFKEYLKAPSPMYEHQSSTGHSTSVEYFSILGRERQKFH